MFTLSCSARQSSGAVPSFQLVEKIQENRALKKLSCFHRHLLAQWKRVFVSATSSALQRRIPPEAFVLPPLHVISATSTTHFSPPTHTSLGGGTKEENGSSDADQYTWHREEGGKEPHPHASSFFLLPGTAKVGSSIVSYPFPPALWPLVDTRCIHPPTATTPLSSSFVETPPPLYVSRVCWPLLSHTILQLPSAVGGTADAAAWGALLASLRMCRGDAHCWRQVLYAILDSRHFFELEEWVEGWEAAVSSSLSAKEEDAAHVGRSGTIASEGIPNPRTGPCEDGQEGVGGVPPLFVDGHLLPPPPPSSSFTRTNRRLRASKTSSSSSFFHPASHTLLFSIDALSTGTYWAQGERCRPRPPPQKTNGDAEWKNGDAPEERKDACSGGEIAWDRREDEGCLSSSSSATSVASHPSPSSPPIVPTPTLEPPTTASSSSSLFPIRASRSSCDTIALPPLLRMQDYHVGVSLWTSTLTPTHPTRASLSSSSPPLAEEGRWIAPPRLLQGDSPPPLAWQHEEINLGRWSGKGGLHTRELRHALRSVMQDGVRTLKAMVEEQAEKRSVSPPPPSPQKVGDLSKGMAIPPPLVASTALLSSASASDPTRPLLPIPPLPFPTLPFSAVARQAMAAHSTAVRQQNAFDVPDVGLMWEEIEYHTQCPIEFTCEQEALHHPPLRLAQLLSGYPGDVEIRTKVTVRLGAKNAATTSTTARQEGWTGLRYIATSRPSPPPLPSSPSAVEDYSRHEIQSYMARMEGEVQSGQHRGPLLLLIEAVMGLYALVFSPEGMSDAFVLPASPLAATWRHRMDGEEVSGGGGRRFRGRRRRSAAMALGSRMAAPRKGTDTSIRRLSFPLLSVARPETRQGIDFLVFSWFGSTPQLRSFDIQPHRDREQYVYKGRRYDTMKRVMLFYDILGYRLLFAESHHWELSTALRRLHAVAVRLNMPWRDGHPPPPLLLGSGGNTMTPFAWSSPSSSANFPFGKRQETSTKEEKEGAREEMGPRHVKGNGGGGKETSPPPLSSAFTLLLQSLSGHQKTQFLATCPLPSWNASGAAGLASTLPTVRRLTAPPPSPTAVSWSSMSPFFSSLSSSSLPPLATRTTDFAYRHRKDITCGVYRQQALVQLVYTTVWGAPHHPHETKPRQVPSSSSSSPHPNEKTEKKKPNRRNEDASVLLPPMAAHSSSHRELEGEEVTGQPSITSPLPQRNATPHPRRADTTQARRLQRRALRYGLRQQPSQLVALMSVLEGLGRLTLRFVPDQDAGDQDTAAEEEAKGPVDPVQDLVGESSGRGQLYGGGGVAEVFFQLRQRLPPPDGSSSSSRGFFSCRHHVSIQPMTPCTPPPSPPLFVSTAVSSSSFSFPDFLSAPSTALREGRMEPAGGHLSGILPAFTYLCQRTLEEVYRASPPLHERLLPLPILFQTAMEADPLLPLGGGTFSSSSSSLVPHHGFPAYHPSFYSPPALLGQLLDGVCGKYHCAYDLVPLPSIFHSTKKWRRHLPTQDEEEGTPLAPLSPTSIRAGTPHEGKKAEEDLLLLPTSTPKEEEEDDETATVLRKGWYHASISSASSSAEGAAYAATPPPVFYARLHAPSLTASIAMGGGGGGPDRAEEEEASGISLSHGSTVGIHEVGEGATRKAGPPLHAVPMMAYKCALSVPFIWCGHYRNNPHLIASSFSQRDASVAHPQKEEDEAGGTREDDHVGEAIGSGGTALPSSSSSMFLLGVGYGRTKREAWQQAARHALACNFADVWDHQLPQWKALGDHVLYSPPALHRIRVQTAAHPFSAFSPVSLPREAAGVKRGDRNASLSTAIPQATAEDKNDKIEGEKPSHPHPHPKENEKKMRTTSSTHEGVEASSTAVGVSFYWYPPSAHRPSLSCAIASHPHATPSLPSTLSPPLAQLTSPQRFTCFAIPQWCVFTCGTRPLVVWAVGHGSTPGEAFAAVAARLFQLATSPLGVALPSRPTPLPTTPSVVLNAAQTETHTNNTTTKKVGEEEDQRLVPITSTPPFTKRMHSSLFTSSSFFSFWNAASHYTKSVLHGQCEYTRLCLTAAVWGGDGGGKDGGGAASLLLRVSPSEDPMTPAWYPFHAHSHEKGSRLAIQYVQQRALRSTSSTFRHLLARTMDVSSNPDSKNTTTTKKNEDEKVTVEEEDGLVLVVVERHWYRKEASLDAISERGGSSSSSAWWLQTPPAITTTVPPIASAIGNEKTNDNKEEENKTSAALPAHHPHPHPPQAKIAVRSLPLVKSRVLFSGDAATEATTTFMDAKGWTRGSVQVYPSAKYGNVLLFSRLLAWWTTTQRALEAVQETATHPHRIPSETTERATPQEPETKHTRMPASSSSATSLSCLVVGDDSHSPFPASLSPFHPQALSCQWGTFQTSFWRQLQELRSCYRYRPLQRCEAILSRVFGVPIKAVVTPFYTPTWLPPSPSSALPMTEEEAEGEEEEEEEETRIEAGLRCYGWRATLLARVPLLPSPFPDPMAPSGVWWVVCTAETTRSPVKSGTGQNVSPLRHRAGEKKDEKVEREEASKGRPAVIGALVEAVEALLTDTVLPALTRRP